MVILVNQVTSQQTSTVNAFKVKYASPLKATPPSFQVPYDSGAWKYAKLQREFERAAKMVKRTSFSKPVAASAKPLGEAEVDAGLWTFRNSVPSFIELILKTPDTVVNWFSLMTFSTPTCDAPKPEDSQVSTESFSLLRGWFNNVKLYWLQIGFVCTLVWCAIIFVTCCFQLFIDHVLQTKGVKAVVAQLIELRLDPDTKKVTEMYSDGTCFIRPQAYSPGCPFNIRERAFSANPLRKVDSIPPNSQVLIYHLNRKIGAGVRIGNDILTAEHVIEDLNPEEIFIGNLTSDMVYPICVANKGKRFSAYIHRQKATRTSPEFAVITPCPNIFALLGVKAARYTHCKENMVVKMIVKRDAGLMFSTSTVSKPLNPLKEGLPLQGLHACSSDPGDSGTPMYDGVGNLVGIHLGFNVNTGKNYFFPVYLIRAHHTESDPVNGDMYPDYGFTSDEDDDMKQAALDARHERLDDVVDAYYRKKEQGHSASALSRPKGERTKSKIPSGGTVFRNFQDTDRVVFYKNGQAVWADAEEQARLDEEDQARFDAWRQDNLYFEKAAPLANPDSFKLPVVPPIPLQTPVVPHVEVEKSVVEPKKKKKVTIVEPVEASLPESTFGKIKSSGIPIPIRPVSEVLSSLNEKAPPLIPEGSPMAQKESKNPETQLSKTSSKRTRSRGNRQRKSSATESSTESSRKSEEPNQSTRTLSQSQLQTLLSLKSLLSELGLEKS
jgi:hypothetical protein